MGIKKAYYRHYFILYLYYLIYCFVFLCFFANCFNTINTTVSSPFFKHCFKFEIVCYLCFSFPLAFDNPPLEISIELFRHLRLSHFIIHYTVTSFSILIISFCCFIHCLFISLIISFSFFFLSSFFYVNLISLRNKR